MKKRRELTAPDFESMTPLARYIAEKRHSLGISRNTLSLQLGYNGCYISQIENRLSLPGVKAVFKICKFLGLDETEALRLFELSKPKGYANNKANCGRSSDIIYLKKAKEVLDMSSALQQLKDSVTKFKESIHAVSERIEATEDFLRYEKLHMVFSYVYEIVNAESSSDEIQAKEFSIAWRTEINNSKKWKLFRVISNYDKNYKFINEEAGCGLTEMKVEEQLEMLKHLDDFALAFAKYMDGKKLIYTNNDLEFEKEI